MYSDDVQQNRLRNFRRILKSIGGTNEAARMMNKKNTYITHIAGPTPVRNIGIGIIETGNAEAVANRLEKLAAAIRNAAKRRF